MKTHSTFIFDSFDFDPGEGTIQLRYSLDNEIDFVETLTLPSSREWPRPATYDADALRRSLLALHIIGGISYYKTCLPKAMSFRFATLTKDQAAFWNSVYENGLGEFFAHNDIDFHGLINFPFTDKPAPPPTTTARATWKGHRVLVPIGGGKDSLVTLELLRAAKHGCTLLRLGQHPLIDAMAKTANVPLLTVKRALSKNLFELNAQGALNGHVPITAYLSCLSVVLSVLYGYDAIAFSNERSANEGNVIFKGKEINHQWSKSVAFERAFQTYLRDHVTGGIDYFSLLRPLSELQIAELLIKYRQYLQLFTSCNTNWKIVGKKQSQRWCGACPKCAFSYALLAAFLPLKDLLGIFGANFFDADPLQKYYRELLGLEGHKPFECVGTVEETSAAFLLAHRKGELEDTKAMGIFAEKILPTIKNPDALIASVMTASDDHAIPEEFVKALPRSS